MRWQYLVLALLLVTFAAGTWEAAPAGAAQASGAMAVDCNAAAGGVQTSCAYPSGATFDAQMHVTKAPGGGYFAHQVKVRWTDAQLNYLPKPSPADENLWAPCTYPARRNNETSQPTEPSVLYACIPFPIPAQGDVTTGAVLQFQFQCQQDGTTPLTLVPRAGDPQLGTHFLDQTATAIDPVLAGATVQCGAPSYGVSWGAHSTPTVIAPGTTATVNVSFTNTGSLTWAAGGTNPVRLSYHWLSGPCPGAATVLWDGRRATLSGDVAPGGTVAGLALSVQAPSATGQHCLVYDLVREGVTWFSRQGAATLRVPVNVSVPTYGVAWGSHNTPAAMAPAGTATVNVSLTNAGSLTWEAGGVNPVRLSYHWLSGPCPGATTVVWDGRRAALPGDVAPGGAVTGLALSVQAPSAAGQHCLVYDLVREGVTWFSRQGAATLRVTVNVTGP